jgi:prepilin-type N-terminal cleavage/methylation domain-containing protein
MKRETQKTQKGLASAFFCRVPSSTFHVSRSRGFGLIELLIGSAIAAIVFIAIFSAYSRFLAIQLENPRQIKASFLLEEGLETMRFLRDSGWAGNIAPLSTSSVYYLYWSGATWQPTTTAQVIDGLFYRTLAVSDVKRNASDDIAALGTYDPYTKQMAVSVAWLTRTGTTTKTSATYIADLFTN